MKVSYFKRKKERKKERKNGKCKSRYVESTRLHKITKVKK